MFMHDASRAIYFAQTHGQTKFERFTLAARIDVDAPSYCRRIGNILTTSDLHIVPPDGFKCILRSDESWC